MPAAGRVGDKSACAADAHGCPGCAHSVVGPAISGSPNVLINDKPALRVGDPGIHAACCGPNTWQAIQGSPNVFINGRAAHRVGDADQHCGGVGQLVEGSPNVFINELLPAPLLFLAPVVDPVLQAILGFTGQGGPSGPLGPFRTQDDAARAALNMANPRSIAENREYVGMTYQDPRTGYYYATNPQPAGLDGGSLPTSRIPDGCVETGFYHTHGNHSLRDGTPTDAAHDEYDSNHFSRQDIRTAVSRAKGNPNYRSYLGTPSNGYLVHDPTTGRIAHF